MTLGILIGLTLVANLLLALLARFMLTTIFSELNATVVNVATVLVFIYLTAICLWMIYKLGQVEND